MDIGYLLYLQRESPVAIDYLPGFALLIHFDACEERRMSLYCGLNSRLQALCVQTAVQYIQIGNVVTRLSGVL